MYIYIYQEEKEKKRLEQLERKKELQQLHDEEMSSIKGCKQPQASKVTRATIQANQEKIEAEAKGRSCYLTVLKGT